MIHFRDTLAATDVVARFLSLIAAALLVLSAGSARAGLSGENVILVVNADDVGSRTIANHYASLRQVPSANVVYLNEVPTGLTCSLVDFRERILQPILTKVNERRLASHARAIVYSSGFPTGVKIDEHTSTITDPDQKKYQLPVAALNGLTYFYRFILADNPNYLSWTPNLYARGAFERHFVQPLSGEIGDAFDAATKSFNEEDFESAANQFAELAKKIPLVSPVSIRAAEAFARMGKDKEAKQWIFNAIRGGWSSGKYLRESIELGELVGSPPLDAVVDSLGDAPLVLQDPVGFFADRSWTNSGHMVTNEQGGVPYMLSCLLGVVHERGSTVEQIVEYLKKAAQADRTRPAGKFGFAKTKDVRSTTRMPSVPSAIGRLLLDGRTPEVFASTLPTSTDTYAGLMLGTATMNLRDRRFKIAPGAICESLTSTGAAFGSASQTKCTELLHAGAAISSGAVTEPYSIPFKFPSPAIHAYYAEGVTAIEAFYLSVTSPYQLLIVGDPVCQPFAKPPTDSLLVRVDKPAEDSTEVIYKRVESTLAKVKRPTASIEIFVEGRRVQLSPRTNEIRMKLSANASGFLRTRVAYVGGGTLATRISLPRVIDLDGPIPAPEIRVSSDQLEATVNCSGADAIELTCLGESIGKIKGESGTVALDRSRLGDGPLRLRATAVFGDQASRSRPFVLQ